LKGPQSMNRPRRRVTQQDIARLAGVSQATVSLVLNDRLDAGVRIGTDTRERVQRVIRETGYVADPVARSLANQHNRIIGVFTYEPVFPRRTRDFYVPFMMGIEENAERLACDLLLMTSAPVRDGRRRIFHENNRLRLADGCLLLGRHANRDELAQLVAEEFPFVSIGRRDDAGGPVPYVGADYSAAVTTLVEWAVAAGHRRLAYIGAGTGAESPVDRFQGFSTGLVTFGIAGRHQKTDGLAALPALLEDGVTAFFVEEAADCDAFIERLGELGLSVPEDVSVVALGDPTRPEASAIDVATFHIPRREMGLQAVELLNGLLEGTSDQTQRLLPCEPHSGTTLGPPGPTK